MIKLSSIITFGRARGTKSLAGILLLLTSLPPLTGPFSVYGLEAKLEKVMVSRGQFGLSYDGRWFWSLDPLNSTIVRIADSHQGITTSFALRLQGMRGLTFNPDDNLLYTAIPGYLVQIDPTSAKPLKKFPVKLERPRGLANDKNFFYVFDYNQQAIVSVDKRGLRAVGHNQLPVKKPKGMTFFRGQLWIIDGEKNQVIKVAPDKNFRVLGSLVAPAPGARGITFARDQLYLSFRDNRLVQRVDYQESLNYLALGSRVWQNDIRLILRNSGKVDLRDLTYTILPPTDQPYQKSWNWQIRPAATRVTQGGLRGWKVRIGNLPAGSARSIRLRFRSRNHTIRFFEGELESGRSTWPASLVRNYLNDNPYLPVVGSGKSDQVPGRDLPKFLRDLGEQLARRYPAPWVISGSGLKQELHLQLRQTSAWQKAASQGARFQGELRPRSQSRAWCSRLKKKQIPCRLQLVARSGKIPGLYWRPEIYSRKMGWMPVGILTHNRGRFEAEDVETVLSQFGGQAGGLTGFLGPVRFTWSRSADQTQKPRLTGILRYTRSPVSE